MTIINPTLNKNYIGTINLTDKKGNKIIEHPLKYNPENPNNPDVVILSTKNPKTGELEDQTLPLKQVSKLYSHAQKKAVGWLIRAMVFLPIIGCDILERSQGIDRNAPLTTGVGETPVTIENIKEKMTISKEIENKELGHQGMRFINSLAENKESLMKDLELDVKQYDNLADIALKISNNESQLGESPKYRGFLAAESYVLGALGASEYRSATHNDENSEVLSRGMTQYKIALASDEEKELFDKYGITYDNLTTNIQYPEKSAIATMIHLGSLQKGYEEYSQKMDEIAPDLNDKDVQKSIINAKNIINSDNRKLALKALTAKNNSEDEAEKLKAANLTQDDLNDLRTYAKTIKLPEKAFVAAGWPGKNIRPWGKNQDLGCANLINASAGVGYIANICNDL